MTAMDALLATDNPRAYFVAFMVLVGIIGCLLLKQAEM